MSTSSTIAWFLTFILAYLVTPVALVWGWIRSARDRQQLLRSFSIFSFCGLILASASALLGLWLILYAFAGGFGTIPEHNGPEYELFTDAFTMALLFQSWRSCSLFVASGGKAQSVGNPLQAQLEL
jgi:hypothetical protein